MNRVGQVIDGFDDAGIDALIVSDASNIRYLTGFSGSHGTLLITAAGPTLLTDNRYAERAAEEMAVAGVNAALVIAPGAARQQLLGVLEPASRIGIEAQHVSWEAATSLVADLGEERVVKTSGIVEAAREHKDADEIETMRHAASIADAALTELLERFGPGMTERQVARKLDDLVLDGGAGGRAFDTIVASGPNASRPHHEAGDRELSRGDLVIIDFGAEYRGYRSDMTRSFVLGEPSARQREMLDGVREAQQAGVDAVAPGVAAAGIDEVCRTHLGLLGLGEWFTHGTGHGVGLDIHEAPSVSERGTATLAAGHVITVEPGVYVPEFGGVRWEDTLVVTPDGAEPLTRSPKQPVVV